MTAQQTQLILSTWNAVSKIDNDKNPFSTTSKNGIVPAENSSSN